MPLAINKQYSAIARISGNTKRLNTIWLLVASLLVLLACLPNVLTAAESFENDQIEVTSVFVNRVNIFAPEVANQVAVYRAANWLHRTTREKTILRELGVSVGDRVGVQDIAEFERVLRRTDLFASVSVTLQPAKNGKATELHINTQDRLSIVAGASGSFLGGVGELGFTLGERNVAGLGDSLLFNYTGNSENEIRGSLSYSDLHFINKDQRALYQVGRTEEGNFYRVRFQRPFKSRLGENAWSIGAESVERDIDFFENGVSVVQVPEERLALDISRVWRKPTDQRSLRRGVVFQYVDLAYQATRGVQADTIDRPADTTQFYAGFLLAHDTVTEYRKVSSLDTLKFTQDLTLGSVAELQVGLIHTDYSNTIPNRGQSLAPRADVRLARSFAAGQDSLLRFSMNGSAVFNDISGGDNPLGDNRPWSVTAAARWFNTSFKSHTLATRLDYTFAESDSDVPVQFTLGENNGLRGYARRFLSGRERARLNIEDRIDLDWRLGVVDVGLIGFFDAGWVADEDGASELRRSAGFGFRFGSNVVLGANVIRMDIAVPLDDDEENNDPTLSISVGQVFGF